MTKAQLTKALKAANLTATISGVGRTIEVELQNETDMRKFCRKVAKWGGYKTGWGGWVLRPVNQDMGDFNHPSSRYHY